jgi:hypothetical protein
MPRSISKGNAMQHLARACLTIDLHGITTQTMTAKPVYFHTVFTEILDRKNNLEDIEAILCHSYASYTSSTSIIPLLPLPDIPTTIKTLFPTIRDYRFRLRRLPIFCILVPAFKLLVYRGSDDARFLTFQLDA